MTYNKTAWVAGGAPGISAGNLNNLETQYDEAMATAANEFLGKTAQAADSANLGGQPAANYLQKGAGAGTQTVSDAVNFQQGVNTELASDAHAPSDDISAYPRGLSTFWLTNNSGWPITTSYGFVVTHNIVGTAGYQEVVEMYSGTDSTVKTRRWFREERDSNNFWQPFEEVYTEGTPGALGNSQVFTSSGTFTVPSGVSRVFAQMWGGGRGGQGGQTASGSGTYPGVGGPGGYYASAWVEVSSGQQISVQVGGGTAGTAGNPSTSPPLPNPGGDSRFGSYVIAPGGGSSTSAYGTTAVAGGPQGSGNYNGGAGGTAYGGAGGSSAGETYNRGVINGGNGSLPGGGGGGGNADYGQYVYGSGGNGVRGEVRVYW